MFTVTDRRERPFFTVDIEFVDRYLTELSGDAFKLLILLSRLEDYAPEDLPELNFEKLLNFSPGQVMKAMAELVRSNLMVIEHEAKRTVYGVTSREEREEAVHAEP